MAFDREKLKAMLRVHEAFRARPYTDTTGHLTIGYGRNLDARGISVCEAEQMLDNDIDDVVTRLKAVKVCLDCVGDVRARVLIDMAFNLGVDGLLGFKRMLGAVARKDFALAADEMLASTWANQVGDRAVSLAAMMRAGV